MLIPATFGQYGFYRGASLEEMEQLPVKFAGKEACIECHNEINEMLVQDVHSEIHCETCHGPGKKHCEDEGKFLLEKPTSRESCGICHSKNAARKKNTIFQVDLKEHNINKQCIECHNPHKPWDLKK